MYSIILLLLFAASSTQLSLEDLHSNITGLQESVEAAHLKYQLHSGTLKPLQLFEKFYGGKLDRESIGRIGGATEAVLEFCRKWKFNVSSETEQDAVLEGIQMMEGLKNDWDAEVDRWYQKMRRVEFVQTPSEAYKQDLKTIWFERISKLPLQPQDHLENPRQIMFEIQNMDIFLHHADMFIHYRTSDMDQDKEKIKPMNVDSFEERVLATENNNPKLTALFANLNNIMPNVDNLVFVRENGAGNEVKMLIEVSKKLNEDYVKFRAEAKDMPPSFKPVLKEVKDYFEKLTNLNYWVQSASRRSDEWSQVTAFLEKFKTSKTRKTEFEDISSCLADVKSSVDFTSEKAKLVELNTTLAKVVSSFNSVSTWLTDFKTVMEPMEEVEQNLRAASFKDEEAAVLELLKNTLWKFNTTEIDRLMKTIDTVDESFTNAKSLLATELSSTKPRDILNAIKTSINNTGYLAAIDCFQSLLRTIPNMKKTISEVKVLNGIGSFLPLVSAVNTLDYLKEVRVLHRNFEALKLTDPAKVKPIDNPAEKINTLKDGISALESILDFQKIAKKLTGIYGAFENVHNFNELKKNVLKFFGKVERPGTPFETLKSISKISQIPSFQVTQELIDYAKKWSSLDMTKFPEFEGKWAELHEKIGKMSTVVEELENWSNKQNEPDPCECATESSKL